MNLGGAHGGFEGGEAVVEGAEHGDHALRIGSTPLQRFPQHARPLRQDLDRLRSPHRRRSPRVSSPARRWMDGLLDGVGSRDALLKEGRSRVLVVLEFSQFTFTPLQGFLFCFSNHFYILYLI